MAHFGRIISFMSILVRGHAGHSKSCRGNCMHVKGDTDSTSHGRGSHDTLVNESRNGGLGMGPVGQAGFPSSKG